MLSDLMVNYMNNGIKKTFDLEGSELKEKVIADKKVKFKFERGSLKLQIEFGEHEITQIIYDNFIDKEWHKSVTLNDFREYFNDYLATTNDTTINQIEVAADKICQKISSSKLPFRKQ